MLKILNSFFLFSIISASLALLYFTGRGLSGVFVLLFFLFLLLVFLLSGHLRSKEILNKGLAKKSLLLVQLFLLASVTIAWLSINDFFFVEMLKNFAFDFSDNTYWIIFFSGILPIIFISFPIIYFLGSRNPGNSIRILVFLSIFANSNLNDILYYRLLGEPFPELWTWLYQPAFIFGSELRTSQVIIWCLLTILMSLFAFFLPYEALFNKEAEEEERERPYSKLSLFVVIVFSVASMLVAYDTIPKIKNSLFVNGPAFKNQQNEELVEKIRKSFPDSDESFSALDIERIELAKKIIFQLNDGYFKDKTYPLSQGNCVNKWDSSFADLPFSVDGQKVMDPGATINDSCDFAKGAKNILYYSDGQRFALLLDGDTIPKDYENLYIPGERDVYWFDEDIRFYRDWSWNDKMIVFMYKKGEGITVFADPAETEVKDGKL
jgi:hypothetical protein